LNADNSSFGYDFSSGVGFFLQFGTFDNRIQPHIRVYEALLGGDRVIVHALDPESVGESQRCGLVTPAIDPKWSTTARGLIHPRTI
jgi:hypothetical protein